MRLPFTLLLTAFVASPVFAAEKTSGFTLLKFSNVEIGRDGVEKESRVVKLLGCQRKSYFGCGPDVEEQLQVTVDDKPVTLPEELIYRISSLYTQVAFSYYTKGFDDNSGTPPEMICTLGGNARGTSLQAYYHTNGEDIYKVEKSELRPISVEGSNCLFFRRVSPKDAHSLDASIRLRTILHTLSEIYSKPKANPAEKRPR